VKIALVHMRHAQTGGTERYLNQLAAFLAERGDDVAILCRSHGELPHPRARFEVLRPLAVGAAMRMTSFARAVERHVLDVRRVGVHPYDVVFGLGKTWTHDVIRLGGGCHQTYLQLAGREIARKDRLAIAIESRALAPGAYRRVVVNSKMVFEDVAARHGVPREKIRLVYNGVDLERFHPRLRAGAGAKLRSALGISPSEIVCLFLGSGYERKGLDLLVPAFREIAAAEPRARLVVVGRDSDPERFERAAAHAGLSGKVRFLGARADAEVCYAAADLYVLPTRYDPFANTTLEALASGLPAITSRQNGACEILEEGASGSVLPFLEAPAIARAVLSWCDDERRHAGAARARGLAERHPSSATCAQTAAVLDEVLAEKSQKTGARA
jgi:UDP-glucose:(heptosyl)LPS alpha-1,3-glucosyltransferase